LRAIKKILNFIDKHIILIAWTVFFIGNNPVVFNKAGYSVFLLNTLKISWIIVLALLLLHLCISLNFKRILKNLVVAVVLSIVLVVCFFLLASFVENIFKSNHIDTNIYRLSDNPFLSETILTLLCMLALKGIAVLLFTLIRYMYLCIYGITYAMNLRIIFSILYIRKYDLKRIFSVALVLNIMLVITLMFFFHFLPEWAGNIF